MLDRFFDVNTPFWRFMGKVADVILLNLLTVILSLPVITVGASLTALDHTARQVIADTGDGTIRTFLRAWRANIRAATILWLIMGGLGAGLGYLWLTFQDPLLIVVKVLVSLIYLLTFPFVWALQSRFENSIRQTLVNAFRIALGRAPWALAILLADLALVGLSTAVAWYVPSGFFAPLLLGVGLIGCLNVPLLDRALRPWQEPAPAPTSDCRDVNPPP